MELSTILYWIAAAIGALLVYCIILKYKKREHFTEDATATTTATAPTTATATTTATTTAATTATATTTSPTTATATTTAATTTEADNATAINYIESLTSPGFPASTLALYLTSFSDKVNYNEETITNGLSPPDVYDSGMGIWRDFLDSNKFFRLRIMDSATGIIPTEIKTRDDNGIPTDIGLSLNSLRLVGPSSQTLGNIVGSTTSYELTSFTITFYGVIENIEFAVGEQRKVLFHMTAENPNLIEIAVLPNGKDTKNIYIEIILGNAGTSYRWIVDKYVLMSNRMPILYTITFKKGSTTNPSTVTFYIGKTKLPEKDFTLTAPILLGNSEIELNPSGLFNMKLLAFAYFTSVLDESAISGLGKYFAQQHSGIHVALQQKEAEYTAATTNLQNRLLTVNTSLTRVQSELEKCHEAAATALKASPIKPKRYWQVSLDGTGVDKATAKLTDEDLMKCTPLAVASKVAKTVTNKGKDTLPNVTNPTKNTTVPKNFRVAPFQKVVAPQ